MEIPTRKINMMRWQRIRARNIIAIQQDKLKKLERKLKKAGVI